MVDDGTISGTGMNSLNHYAYGSGMGYVFRDLAGIQPLEPGFTRVRFAPQPSRYLQEIRCDYDSASGEYSAGWRINEDGTLTVRFRVPFGCTAEAVLPGSDEKAELTAGEYEKTYRPRVDYGQRYTMDSRLDEMKDDPEAMALLETDLPQGWETIRKNDTELMSLPLQELQNLFFFGFNPGMMEAGTRRLFTLRAFTARRNSHD